MDESSPFGSMIYLLNMLISIAMWTISISISQLSIKKRCEKNAGHHVRIHWLGVASIRPDSSSWAGEYCGRHVQWRFYLSSRPKKGEGWRGDCWTVEGYGMMNLYINCLCIYIYIYLLLYDIVWYFCKSICNISYMFIICSHIYIHIHTCIHGNGEFEDKSTMFFSFETILVVIVQVI